MQVKTSNVAPIKILVTVPTSQWPKVQIFQSKRLANDTMNRPGVIVICNNNSNDYNCSSNSNRWNKMQCNSNRKQSHSN